MSTKVITDPSALGWEQDGATANGTPIYKWAEGADNEHPIVDGNNVGEVTTWDGAKWTPDSSVIVSGGKVGIGKDSDSSTTLDVGGNFRATKQTTAQYPSTGSGVEIYSLDVGGEAIGSVLSYDRGASKYSDLHLNGAEVHIQTAGFDRLTIDASGDATFSGTARFETLDNPIMLRGSEDSYSIGVSLASIGASGVAASIVYSAWQTHKFTATGGGGAHPIIYAEGNATFSGTVNAEHFSATGNLDATAVYCNGVLKYGVSGLQFEPNAVMPVHNTGTPQTGQVDLGSSTFQFRQLFALTTRSQRVIQDGSPVIDAKGLIKTLSTLRNATKDETTLEGLRDAIGNAIGGLIEEFENQIATMPAEEQASKEAR